MVVLATITLAAVAVARLRFASLVHWTFVRLQSGFELAWLQCGECVCPPVVG